MLVSERPPEALTQGDVFLLSDTPFAVASDPAIALTDGMPLFEGPGQDVVRLGQHADTVTQRFSARVGRRPLDYLIYWRMTLARSRSRRTATPIARVAAEVGYSSQSAFAQPFKRTFGVTPRSAVAGGSNPGCT